jgi:NitT/TauT family transport system ATP-binding protein
MKTAIEIKGITKSYGDKKIFSDFSLSIKEGEMVSVIGSNGCGKTTLMNILAGVTLEDSGSINLNSKNISYVFQNYRESLLPWKNNYENVAFPLEIKGHSVKEIEKKVKDLEKIFGVGIKWDDYPYNLSGGQQQILSFFRALLSEPRIILIDEAFSALDFENNLLLRKILQKYYIEKKPTVVMITHNIEEGCSYWKQDYYFT